MEKNIEYYRKRNRIYIILCPLFLLTTIILLFVMNGMIDDHTNDWYVFNTPIGYASIIFGVLGLIFFSLWNRNNVNEDLFLQKLKAEKREQEYNEIVKLMQLGQSQEAIDKLNEWKNYDRA
jgi:hypothetical protein